MEQDMWSWIKRICEYLCEYLLYGFIACMLGMLSYLLYNWAKDKWDERQSDVTKQGLFEKKPSFIGAWRLQNDVSKDGRDIVFAFKKDGTGSVVVMLGDGNREDADVEWTKTGDKIYIATKGEKEVLIIQILSVDNKSMVVRDCRGVIVREGEYLYFSRENP